MDPAQALTCDVLVCGGGVAGCMAAVAAARQGADEALKMAIYERRVLAETAISRPVMKAFKAMIRGQGLFEGTSELAREFE